MITFTITKVIQIILKIFVYENVCYENNLCWEIW